MAVQFLTNSIRWNPVELFAKCNKNKFAVVVLNYGLQDLSESQAETFVSIWNRAYQKISVDGGTNFLHQFKDRISLPTSINGDFDSIDKNLLEYYEKKGVKINCSPDQNYTDFSKSLQLLSENNDPIEYVITFWQQKYRIDHTFSCIHTLHEWRTKFPIFLIDLKGSISWLLVKGNHQIRSNHKAKWCSVVPFCGKCQVSSTGLLYDMNNLDLEFGKIISSSNAFDLREKKVNIQVSKEALWSQDLQI